MRIELIINHMEYSLTYVGEYTTEAGEKKHEYYAYKRSFPRTPAIKFSSASTLEDVAKEMATAGEITLQASIRTEMSTTKKGIPFHKNVITVWHEVFIPTLSDIDRIVSEINNSIPAFPEVASEINENNI